VFKNQVVFKKNFCQVIVNTSRDRLKVQDWNHGEEAVSEAMGLIWKRCFQRPSVDIHVNALVHGESYMMLWPDAQGVPKAYYHSPTQAHVMYEEGDPYTPRVGVKIWQAQDKRHMMNLYYADRIVHLAASTEPPKAVTAYRVISEDPNPYGVMPLFHFQLSQPELTIGIISLQDALNKLLNDMMVTSEYSAFNQRWAIGNFDDGPIDVGPATTVKIPPGVEGEQSASTGVYPASSPANYLESIGALTNDMAALSGTPKHYFEGQGANISGEALHTMEGPLVSKIELFQEQLAITWAQAMAFGLAIDGTAADAEDIEVIWKDPHTQQPLSHAQTRLTNTQAGIPIKNILRDEGWTDEQLEELDADAGTAAQATAAPGQPVTPRPAPQTPEQAAPRFDGAVQTPDIAGEIARNGMLTRAINRRQASN